ATLGNDGVTYGTVVIALDGASIEKTFFADRRGGRLGPPEHGARARGAFEHQAAPAVVVEPEEPRRGGERCRRARHPARPGAGAHPTQSQTRLSPLRPRTPRAAR